MWFACDYILKFIKTVRFAHGSTGRKCSVRFEVCVNWCSTGKRTKPSFGQNCLKLAPLKYKVDYTNMGVFWTYVIIKS